MRVSFNKWERMVRLSKTIKYQEIKEKIREVEPNSGVGATVLVIGAGVSGLCVAHELSRIGFNVTILEKDSVHIGGRLRTYREDDGTYCEFGAMRIPERHALTREYISEMNLQLRPFVQDSDKTFYCIRGVKVNRGKIGQDVVREKFDMVGEEKGMSADAIWEKAVLEVLSSLTDEEMDDLYSIEPKTERIIQLDQKSLLDAFKDAGFSDEAIEYTSSIYGLETYLNTAFTEHLREEAEEVWVKSMSEVVGGTDLLANSLSESVKDDIIKGARVVKCAQQGERYSVTYEKNGEIYFVESDWVVCTAPLGTLVGVDLADCITPQQRKAIRVTNYDSSIKVLVKCRRRFWEIDDGIFGGGTIWDGGLGHTWYPSDNAARQDSAVSRNPSYLLAAYTWGQNSRQLDAMKKDDLSAFVKEKLKLLHPTMRDDDIIKTTKWSWNSFSGSAGAFAFFNPRDFTSSYKHLKSSTGKFIFAGEHCSLTHSWIQGALESALDVCQEILKKEGYGV